MGIYFVIMLSITFNGVAAYRLRDVEHNNNSVSVTNRDKQKQRSGFLHPFLFLEDRKASRLYVSYLSHN